MNNLKSIINLSEEEKELYCKLDFSYFLNCKIGSDKWSQDKISTIRNSYQTHLLEYEQKAKKNRAQFYLFIEGYIRKQHSGGFLTTHFNLNEFRESESLDDNSYGENWAIFELWSKYHKRKLWISKSWKRIVEFGSIIAWVLAFVQLYQIVR